MATSSKPTGVHVSLIIFVMTTIIFAVMWYIQLQNTGDNREAAKKAEGAVAVEQKARRDQEDNLTAIKKTIGADPKMAVGKDGDADPTTVIGFLNDLVNKTAKTSAGDLKKNTVRDTMLAMYERIQQLQRENNSLQDNLNDSKAKVVSLQAEYDSRQKVFDDRAQNAEGELRKRVALMDEVIKKKDEEIEALSKDMLDVQVNAENEKNRLERRIEELTHDNDKLIAQNNRLQDLLNDVTQDPSGIPDGIIRWVDPVAGLVWINIGEAEKLPIQTTFSVYTRDNNGIGRRGREDIKGGIEVTRIIGEHLAEARIVNSDIYRPFLAGDPIYSPMWSPGSIHYFALVGRIDFDHDGRDDRQKLHTMMNSQNAVIETEVDDQGVVDGPGITVKTKFLVVGGIPDPQKALPSEQEGIKNTMAALEKLEKDARQQGVRKINLDDFLNQIGYTSTRRLWVPGEQYPYTLKAGAKSVGVNESTYGRESTGHTSGLFDPARKVKSPTSNGSTSKIFSK